MAHFVIQNVKIKEMTELVQFVGRDVLPIILIVVYCVLLKMRVVLKRLFLFLLLLLDFWVHWLV